MEHNIDARNKRFGRLASEVAVILQGKTDPSYERNRVANVKVYVKNIDKVTISGNKAADKMYYRHTGYMGHLKELSFEEAFAKDPKKVFREAVKHMMPKNFLNQQRIKNLVFIEEKDNG